MNSFLLTLTALFILVLGALFAAPLFIDWNNYRPAIESQMSKLVGRDVKVDGKVHLIVLPAPQLKFDDIKVASADGSVETPFLEAKTLEAKIDVGTLLTGKIEARQLALIEPVLRLHVDRTGKGNWSDIGPGQEGGAFIPKDVLLDAVQVTGGTVEFVEEGTSTFVFTNVQGEASATSLSGPYKVSASYDYEGRSQSLRLSTGVMDSSGKFRLKTALRDPMRSASYQLDGRVSGLRAIPAYDGTFIMRLSNLGAFASVEPNGPTAPSTPGAPVALEAAPSDGEVAISIAPQQDPAENDAAPKGLRQTASYLEIKGPLSATPDGAKMSGFDLTLHASGRPQILKGDLTLDFQAPFAADASLAARWIDFDALFGATDADNRPSPAAVLRMFADWVLDEADRVSAGSLALNVEQAGLGGDLAGGLDLKLTSADGGVTIDRLNATLPGENTVSASGSLRKGQTGPLFEGPVKVNGSGLRALTRWAAGDRAITGQSFVGDFSVVGAASIGEGEVALNDVSGAVSGTPFSGSFYYRQSGADQGTSGAGLIRIDLKSDRLDLREVLGDEPFWGTSLAAGQSDEEAGAETATKTSLLKLLRDDELHASLEIGELVLPKASPGRLDTNLSLSGGNLDIQSLRFEAPGALSLNGKGRIASVAEAPSGQLDLSVKAESADSLKALTDLAGFSKQVAKSEQLAALAPIDLTGALVASRDGDLTDASLELNGKVGGSDFTMTAKAKGALSAPRDADIEVSGRVDGDRPEALLVLLFPDLPQKRLAEATAQKGTLSVNVSGKPSENLSGSAALETGALSLAYEGSGALKDDGTALHGFASVSTTDASLILPMLGIDPSPSTEGVPLSVSANVAAEAGAIDLEQIKASVADEPIEGAAHFKQTDGGTTFDISARAQHVSLPALLGLFVAWERTDSTEEMLGAVDGDAAQAWPARGIALGLLDEMQGTLTLNAKTMALGAPFQVVDAKLNAKAEGGGLTIETLDGQLFGGAFSGTGTLEPRGSGAALKARAELRQGRLGALSKAVAGAPLAKGTFDLSFDVSGEGLSPPGIVADLTGGGKLTLSKGELTSFSAQPLRQIAAKAAARNGTVTKAEVEADAAKLRTTLRNGTYSFAPVSFDCEVKNGTVEFSPGTLASKGVSTTLETYVDLVGLKLDSEWQMDLTAPKYAKVAPLTVVFSGPLEDAGSIFPKIGTAAIENKMTIDRLQDDVERLETLDVSGGQGEADAPSTAAGNSEAAQAAAAAKAAAERAAQERREAEARAAAEAKAAAEARAAADRAAEERAEAEARAAAERAERARIEANARAEAERAAIEANASASVVDEFVPPLPTHRPANDNAAPDDPIAGILDAEDAANAEDLEAEAEPAPVVAPPPRQRRRVIRRPRRENWKRNYGIFGGIFGGR